jgi:hypothetical protein
MLIIRTAFEGIQGFGAGRVLCRTGRRFSPVVEHVAQVYKAQRPIYGASATMAMGAALA